jgi:hypothetical protein
MQQFALLRFSVLPIQLRHALHISISYIVSIVIVG